VTQISETPAPNNTGPCEYGYLAGGPTTLRCAKCTRPLMVKDARQTPVGYVCPNYVKGRVSMAYNAGPQHYVVTVLIALVLGAVAGFALRLVSNVGFFGFLLMTFAGPIAGGIIAEAIRRTLKAMGNARGQYIWITAAICVGITGGIFLVLPALLSLLLGGNAGGLIGGLIGLYGLGVTIATVVARLRI